MTKYFYDTNSLLLRAESLFNNDEFIIISSITLDELENIKTSSNKDSDTKYQARQVLRALELNPEKCSIHTYNDGYYQEFIEHHDFSLTNDIKIISCALAEQNISNDEIIFVTNDLSCKHIAKNFLPVLSVEQDTDPYCGYKEITMTDEEMAHFYSSLYNNIYDLEVNEYIIIKNTNDEMVDVLKWTEQGYRHLKNNNFKSVYFGDIKPIKGDIYQLIAMDSLANNQITQLRGKSGSGKSYLALGFLFHKLEKHEIDKIVIFCNPVATRDSAKLGFYPGDKNSKLLDSQIGNFLRGKLGGNYAIEQLLQEEKLLLIPISDCRGFDTTGMRAGVYFTEAQNATTDIMKLVLQRIGEDSICVIDGDNKSQVDLEAYSGEKNGMKRMSKVFRGQDFYGEVELNIIHRSRIAERADLM